jgi:hypothetical protein
MTQTAHKLPEVIYWTGVQNFLGLELLNFVSSVLVTTNQTVSPAANAKK